MVGQKFQGNKSENCLLGDPFKWPYQLTPHRVVGQLRIPQNVRVAATPNGRMTGLKMREYFNRIWGQNVDDMRRLIILDRVRVHTMQDTQSPLDDLERDVMYIPAGCTSLVSWMDHSSIICERVF